LRKYQLFTANRLAKRGLSNVRLCKADARLFLRDHVASRSVQAVHVYFSDPWWKKLHLKRRGFTPELGAQGEQGVPPEGMLYVVMDVDDYFGVIPGLVCGHTALRLVPVLERAAKAHDLDYLTNFERKFRKEGQPIFRSVYQAASSP